MGGGWQALKQDLNRPPDYFTGTTAVPEYHGGEGITSAVKKQLFDKGVRDEYRPKPLPLPGNLSLTRISIADNGGLGAGARCGILVPGGGYRFSART